MTDDRHRPAPTEQDLSELLAALPPAPAGWVRAAQELPEARRSIDGLVARATEHEDRRRAVLDDLEGTLRAAGVAPLPSLVAELRDRLRAADDGS